MATKTRKKNKVRKLPVIDSASQAAAQGMLGAIVLSPEEALTLAMCITNCVQHLDPPDDVTHTLAWIGAQLETKFSLTMCEKCNKPCFCGDECDDE